MPTSGGPSGDRGGARRGVPLHLRGQPGPAAVQRGPISPSSAPCGTRRCRLGHGGIILSGGFPEVYAEPLAANRPMHDALRAAHRQGLPIYAECGGLMYLTQAIVDGDGAGTRWSACCRGIRS